MEEVWNLTGTNLALAKWIHYQCYLDLRNTKVLGYPPQTLYHFEARPLEDVQELNETLSSLCEKHGIPLPSAMLGAVKYDPITNGKYIVNTLRWDGNEWQYYGVSLIVENVRIRQGVKQ